MDCGVGKSNRRCDQGYSAAFGTTPFALPLRVYKEGKGQIGSQQHRDVNSPDCLNLPFLAVVAIDGQGCLWVQSMKKENYCDCH